MKKDIMKDVFFLGQKSENATQEDRQIIEDLKDTLKANHINGFYGCGDG